MTGIEIITVAVCSFVMGGCFVGAYNSLEEAICKCRAGVCDKCPGFQPTDGVIGKSPEIEER